MLWNVKKLSEWTTQVQHYLSSSLSFVYNLSKGCRRRKPNKLANGETLTSITQLALELRIIWIVNVPINIHETLRSETFDLGEVATNPRGFTKAQRKALQKSIYISPVSSRVHQVIMDQTVVICRTKVHLFLIFCCK